MRHNRFILSPRFCFCILVNGSMLTFPLGNLCRRGDFGAPVASLEGYVTRPLPLFARALGSTQVRTREGTDVKSAKDSPAKVTLSTAHLPATTKWIQRKEIEQLKQGQLVKFEPVQASDNNRVPDSVLVSPTAKEPAGEKAEKDGWGPLFKNRENFVEMHIC